MSSPLSAAECLRVIDHARLELELAGNPAFAVVLLDAAGGVQLSPMVYASIAPAAAQGQRIRGDMAGGEQVYVVSRSASGRRAQFAIVDPASLRKLHQRTEVIEETFAESDRSI